MRLSSACSFCIIWTLYSLLAESRPLKLGGVIHGIEGLAGDMTGTGTQSSTQECLPNPSPSAHTLVLRRKTRLGSGTVGGGSGGGSGSSGGGPTVNSGGSAKPGGRTGSEHMHEEMPGTILASLCFELNSNTYRSTALPCHKAHQYPMTVAIHLSLVLSS
ncbi:hypothetical protein F5146DRAFT_1129425 [Armillaria mellea]|nr:hypothetical protein F5146DRAFT_1129425 [Armillaria mellea]